jgi:hypothetical protein
VILFSNGVSIVPVWFGLNLWLRGLICGLMNMNQRTFQSSVLCYVVVKFFALI